MVTLGDSTVFVYVKLKNQSYWTLKNRVTGNMPRVLNQSIRYAGNIKTTKEYDAIAVLIADPEQIDDIIKTDKELKSYDPVTIIDCTRKKEYTDDTKDVKKEVSEDSDLQRLRRLAGISETTKVNSYKTISEIRDELIEEPIQLPKHKDTEKAFLVCSKVFSTYDYSPDKVVEYVVRKYFNNDCNLSENIIEYITDVSGLDLNEYADQIKENEYSKTAHEWVKKQVDKLYPSHIKSKSEAFGVAWKQWRANH